MTDRDGHDLIAKKTVVSVGYVQKFDSKSTKESSSSSVLTLISVDKNDSSTQQWCGKTDMRSFKSISRTSCALASQQGLLPHKSSEQTLHLPRSVHRRSLRCARHTVRTHGQGETHRIQDKLQFFYVQP